ncbi:hypothetical protein Tco_0187537, partial [Tanacetum coccineum]
MAVEQVTVEQSSGGGAVERWRCCSRAVLQSSSAAVERYSRAAIGEQWWRVVVEHSSGFDGIVTGDGDGN